MKNEMAILLDHGEDQAKEFFLFCQGEQEGPFSFQKLEELFGSEELSPATPCRSRREREWHDLAFILREKSPARIPATTPDPPATEAPNRRKDESLKDLIVNLVEMTERQNRLLTSIRWILLVLVLMTAGVIVALQ